ncbi:MAG: FAD-binding oxidoreductase [Candidatus Poribacteria bacterium]|nr:FAD-binding oxidoreductase [Candidatus Poribacteria bacterium]
MTMPNLHLLHEELIQIVGKNGLLPNDWYNDYRVDGFTPRAVVLPASVQQIRELLTCAADRKLSVIPAGSGTKLGIGNLPQKVDLVLSTRRLDNMVEYEPADLTVTVQAGMRLENLQAQLAENGQYLPLDPTYASLATVGGIAATNASGPLRMRHGTPRNQVLGMRVVQSDGAVVKSGGKVVKNVSGYDLNKLYIGSFGTLGIITELTFKLFPLAESRIIMLLRFQRYEDAVKAASDITTSQLLPSYLNLIINGVPDTTLAESSLVVGLDAHPKAAAWQRNQVQWIAKQRGAIGVEIIQEPQAAKLVEAMRAFAQANPSGQVIVCKANLRMSDIGEYLGVAFAVTNALSWSVRVMGLMGTGQVYFVFSEFFDMIEPKMIASTLAQLRKHAASVGGNLILEAAPVDVKRQIDVWGTVGSGSEIMRKIKAQFDPNMLLNPGRFADGI